MYIPFLMRKGSVLGIDISPNVLQIAKERGLKNIKTANIFRFRSTKKFDTIVLLENNLGMAETPSKTKRLLLILAKLLNNNGQILTNAREIKKKPYYIAEMYPYYKNEKGQKFKWISFNSKFLIKLCSKLRLNSNIVGRSKDHYLLKITKWSY